MEIRILDEEANELLNRKEIRFSVVHDGETPERLAVRDSLAAKLDKSSGEVVVHEMSTKFGMNETMGYAKVYESPEVAQEVEEGYMLERNKIAGDGEPGDDVEEEVAEDQGTEDDAESEEGEEEAEDDGDEGDEADAESEGDEAGEEAEGKEGDDSRDEEDEQDEEEA